MMDGLRIGAVWMGAVLLAGCMGSGDGGERVEVFDVTGTVTMAGSPVANATVIFSPKSQQPVATGRTNDAGEFTLTTYDSGDGAAAGDYEVLISKEAVSASTPEVQHDPNNPEAYRTPVHSAARPTTTSELPAKYSRAGQSGILVTVNPSGDNEFPVELTP